MTDGKIRFTYNYIHNLIWKKSEQIKSYGPDVIIGIGTGGFVPARMLNEHLKLPFYTVIVKLYNDDTNEHGEEPEKIQWLDEKQIANLKGKTVVIVDEVDDTRKTLAFCVSEINKCEPKSIIVFVVNNKKSTKLAKFDCDVTYVAGCETENRWVVYPWEVSGDIYEHNKLAKLENLDDNVQEEENKFFKSLKNLANGMYESAKKFIQ